MRYKQFLKQLPKKDGVVFFNEPLSSHCSFKIGGTAKYFVATHNTQTLLQLFSKTKKFLSLGLEQTLFLQISFFEEQLLNLAATFLKLDAKITQLLPGQA